MVEFAFVLPVLLLLVLGIVNLGWLAAQQIAVNNAARQGGRAAVVVQPIGISAQTKATNAVTASSDTILKAPGVVGTSFPATLPGGASSTTCGTGVSVGKPMTVKVTYSGGNWLAPVPFFTIPHPTLTSTAVYQCEW